MSFTSLSKQESETGLTLVAPCHACDPQQRPDAEAARKALDGLALHGMEMRVGWGKAVPLPPVPLYSGTGVPTGPLTGETHNAFDTVCAASRAKAINLYNYALLLQASGQQCGDRRSQAQQVGLATTGRLNRVVVEYSMKAHLRTPGLFSIVADLLCCAAPWSCSHCASCCDA